jgi:gentisate 1,2-dioxygenase
MGADKAGRSAAQADDSATTEERYREMLPEMPSQHDTNEVAAVLTADQYFQAVRRPDTAPAFWKRADVMKTLSRLGEDPLREAERRFCALVNTDTGELNGATPGIFIGWQLIHPGEEVPPHRHNSVAIYHILQGTGHTAVQVSGGDWRKFHWAPGDTLACPAWAYHAHYAEGDRDTLMFVVQDMPELASKRTLMWEEPLGQENVRHMVAGTSPSWSATRTDAPGAEDAS